MRAGEQDLKYKLCPAISGPSKAGRPKLDKRHTSLMEQAMGKKKKKHQAKEPKKQASSTVTEVGKGKKRKPGTKTHHAPSKKQVATDGTKRVSECQRKKK